MWELDYPKDMLDALELAHRTNDRLRRTCLILWLTLVVLLLGLLAVGGKTLQQ